MKKPSSRSLTKGRIHARYFVLRNTSHRPHRLHHGQSVGAPQEYSVRSSRRHDDDASALSYLDHATAEIPRPRRRTSNERSLGSVCRDHPAQSRECTVNDGRQRPRALPHDGARSGRAARRRRTDQFPRATGDEYQLISAATVINGNGVYGRTRHCDSSTTSTDPSGWMSYR